MVTFYNQLYDETAMAWEFEQVAGPYDFTEGPVWAGEAVYFSNMPSDQIFRYDPDSGETTVAYSDTNAANGLKLDEQGRLYACEMNGRRVVRYEDGERTPIAAQYEGERFNSPNDLAIEDGQLWFTDPYYGAPWEDPDRELELGHRSVYRVDLSDPDLTVNRVTTDTVQPNGLLVSPDRESLYVAEHLTGDDPVMALVAYPINDDLTVGDQEVLYDFSPHRGIDGMCLDEDGNIVAAAGSGDSGPGSMLYVFAPDGRVIDTHPIPDSLPTNCAFAEADLSTIYATGGDGGLYRAETDRAGYLDAR